MTLSTFFLYVGATTLFLCMLIGFVYWMRIALNMAFPDLKYTLKYKLLKRKYNEEDVQMLLEDLETGASEEEIHKAILVNGRKTPSQAKELMWIFRELKKLKGGIKQ